EDVLFAVAIANARRLLIWIVRDLIVVSPRRTDEAQLIVHRGVKNERRKHPAAGPQVMQVVTGGSGQSMVRAIAIRAHVVRGLVGVVAKTDLVVRAVVAAVTGDEFRLMGTFETGARSHVEDTIGAVAVFRRVASPLDLHVVYVLGVELRADVAGNVGVEHGHAVNG